MIRLGARSAFHLACVVKPLQDIVIKATDKVFFTVVAGHVPHGEQLLRHREGDVKWPLSPHNRIPSRAVDLAPPGGVYTAESAGEVLDEIARLAAEAKVPVRCRIEKGILHLEVRDDEVDAKDFMAEP